MGRSNNRKIVVALLGSLAFGVLTKYIEKGRIFRK